MSSLLINVQHANNRIHEYAQEAINTIKSRMGNVEAGWISTPDYEEKQGAKQNKQS